MDIIDRISLLLADREQKELTDYLGLRSVAFSEWKSGKSKSYRKYLIEISEFFNVSLDYLVYGKIKESKENKEVSLTVDEQELLENYRKLDDNKKKEISEKAKEQNDSIKDELYMELSKIISSLPLRERSKLIAMIYDCEEQYRKYGSMQMPQATDLPTSERQLLDVFRQFNDYEQAKVMERIKEWLDVKHRREQINKQKIVGIQIARRNDGTSSGQMPLTAEEAEKIAELPEETNF